MDATLSLCFDRCRDTVSAEAAAVLYGLDVHRHWALCPFHNEKTPSLHFWDGRFKCFGCGESGDSIRFTALLLSVNRMEALRKLNADFSLHLPIDRPATPVERDQANRLTEARQIMARFSAWRNSALNELCEAIRTVNEIIAEDREPDACEAEGVKKREWLEYLIEELEADDMERQMDVFRQRKEVRELCKRILNNTLMKSRPA